MTFLFSALPMPGVIPGLGTQEAERRCWAVVEARALHSGAHLIRQIPPVVSIH